MGGFKNTFNSNLDFSYDLGGTSVVKPEYVSEYLGTLDFSPSSNAQSTSLNEVETYAVNNNSDIDETMNKIGATTLQVGAHVLTGFASVFEDIVDGAAAVLGGATIYGAKAVNWIFGEEAVATDSIEQMENDLMDFTSTDWSKELIADNVDNMEFVQQYSTASDEVLKWSEFGGEVLGNAVLYTVSGGTGVALAGLNGVGKGFNKAVKNGATFEQATGNAILYGGISAASKFGVNQISAAAKAGAKVTMHTETQFASQVADVVSSNAGSLLKGGAVGFSGSIAKNMSDYATYASSAVDDNGNLKYANYAQYFDESDALVDAVGSGVSSAISVGYSAFGASYGSSGKFSSNMTKYASKNLTGEVAHDINAFSDNESLRKAATRSLAGGILG